MGGQWNYDLHSVENVGQYSSYHKPVAALLVLGLGLLFVLFGLQYYEILQYDSYSMEVVVI